MRAPERIYATAAGELVTGDHADAAFLRYAAGDEITKADEPAVKELAKPADKARAKPATKSASD